MKEWGKSGFPFHPHSPCVRPAVAGRRQDGGWAGKGEVRAPRRCQGLVSSQQDRGQGQGQSPALMTNTRQTLISLTPPPPSRDCWVWPAICGRWERAVAGDKRWRNARKRGRADGWGWGLGGREVEGGGESWCVCNRAPASSVKRARGEAAGRSLRVGRTGGSSRCGPMPILSTHTRHHCPSQPLHLHFRASRRLGKGTPVPPPSAATGRTDRSQAGCSAPPTPPLLRGLFSLPPQPIGAHLGPGG